MPRRKISIEDAFNVLQQAGVNVQVKPQVEQVTVPVKAIKEPLFPIKVSAKLIKVKLYSKHSIGSGGSMVTSVDGKQIANAGVETYGPGVCNVPREIVGQILAQDRLAQDADEKMLDKTQRSYLVLRKYNSEGHHANVGVAVSNELFDNGIVNIPTGYMHRL